MIHYCLDLCCGKGGATQAFRGKDDWIVVGVDVDEKFHQYWQGKNVSFVLADVTVVDWSSFLEDVGIPDVDFLWASPPCQRFSVAMPKWPKPGIRRAFDVVASCLEAVAVLKPDYWLLENPKARLRWFLGTPKQTIRYSDYDMQYKAEKLTDIWGTLPLPMPRGQRFLNPRHFDSHWFMRYMPRDVESRNMVPLGVSEAVYQSVQQRLTPTCEETHTK